MFYDKEQQATVLTKICQLAVFHTLVILLGPGSRPGNIQNYPNTVTPEHMPMVIASHMVKYKSRGGEILSAHSAATVRVGGREGERMVTITSNIPGSKCETCLWEKDGSILEARCQVSTVALPHKHKCGKMKELVDFISPRTLK
jgi:hypothetical protein